MQGRLGGVEVVEVAYQALNAGVRPVVEQVPVDLGIVVPLALLGDFAAHEQQLLAGMRPHESEIGAQVGEPLPAVAGHLAYEGPLPVDHFVVRDRQHEALGEGIDQTEGHLVVMVGAIDGLVLDVLQSVVHPAHVPFEREAEPLRQRRRDAGPRRRFLGHHDGAGTAFADDGVEMAQEADRLEILAAAMDVGNPGVCRPAVVAIQHRSHGIDAQPVDMEALQPVQSAGDQEALHLATAEIVDVGIPVVMIALARIEMLVEGRAVETRQPVGVGRKMCRDPVQKHPDSGAMRGIDEAGKRLGRAIDRRRREQAERLIPPRAAKRMLRHREQLDMGKAHLLDVRDEPLRQEIPERTLCGTRPCLLPHPGAGMHFVDGDRRRCRLPVGPTSHPVLVIPTQGRSRGSDDRRRARRKLSLLGDRVCLVGDMSPVRSENVELVAGSRTQTRDENLPNTRRRPQPHRMPAPVPGIEVADHRHALGIRCPHREAHAFHPVHRYDVGTESFGKFEVPTLVEQMKIEIAQGGTKGIRVFSLLDGPGPLDADPIGTGLRNRPLEQAGYAPRLQRTQGSPVLAADYLDAIGTRHEHTHDSVRAVFVRSQHGKCVEGPPCRQGLRRVAIELARRRYRAHALS